MDWSDPNSNPMEDVKRWKELYASVELPLDPDELEHQAIVYLLDQEQD